MNLNKEQLNSIKQYLEAALKIKSDESSLFFDSICIKFFALRRPLNFPVVVNDNCISIYFLLMSIIQLQGSKNIINKYSGEDIFNSLMSFYNTFSYSRNASNNKAEELSTKTNEDIFEWDAKSLALILISLKIVDALYFSRGHESIKERLKQPFSESFKHRMFESGFNPPEVLEYLNSCYNLDYGYGSNPGRESHCGYIYASLCSYRLLIDFFDISIIQSCINTGGVINFYRTLNANPGIKGRKNKHPDLCYNFWVNASIKILNEINATKYEICEIFPHLEKFNKICFKSDSFSPHPECDSDVFHTVYFLLYTQLEFIDPIYLI